MEETLGKSPSNRVHVALAPRHAQVFVDSTRRLSGGHEAGELAIAPLPTLLTLTFGLSTRS